MTGRWLPLLLLIASPALAGSSHTLRYRILAGGEAVGRRTLTVSVEGEGPHPERTLAFETTLDGAVGPMTLAWRQRVQAFAEDGPADFQSVLDEAGRPYEIQARWGPVGWTVSVADRRAARTDVQPGHRIDLSTVDLVDPYTTRPLARMSEARVLSAETGDVWEGAVERLGNDVVTVRGKAIAVTGVAWDGPDGRQTFWYDAEGWLVRFETRVMGVAVEGVLDTTPPPGPDVFPVRAGTPMLGWDPL